MQLKQLEAFSVLADELHFSRAAAKLRISQSALSQQLMRLEADLGVELMRRTSRDIALTEAGLLFLRAARHTLASADRAEALIADYVAGRTGRVVVGSLGAGLNGPLSDAIREFHTAYPQSAVELVHLRDSASLERRVLTGELDFAFLRRLANLRTLRTVRVLDEEFVVFLHDGHRLANRELVDLGELADETFVFWPRRLGTTFYDLIIDGCRAHGFEPRVHSIGDSLEAQLALVAAGVGVSVQAASNAVVGRTGVVAVPLHAEDLRVELWCAWRRSPLAPAGELFLDVVRRHKV